jgi:hypothetical protein
MLSGLRILAPLIVLGAVAFLFIVSRFHDRRRDAELLNMIARRSFIGPGQALPHSLTLEGTALERARVNFERHRGGLRRDRDRGL